MYLVFVVLSRKINHPRLLQWLQNQGEANHNPLFGASLHLAASLVWTTTESTGSETTTSFLLTTLLNLSKTWAPLLNDSLVNDLSQSRFYFKPFPLYVWRLFHTIAAVASTGANVVQRETTFIPGGGITPQPPLAILNDEAISRLVDFETPFHCRSLHTIAWLWHTCLFVKMLVRRPQVTSLNTLGKAFARKLEGLGHWDLAICVSFLSGDVDIAKDILLRRSPTMDTAVTGLGNEKQDDVSVLSPKLDWLQKTIGLCGEDVEWAKVLYLRSSKVSQIDQDSLHSREVAHLIGARAWEDALALIVGRMASRAIIRDEIDVIHYLLDQVMPNVNPSISSLWYQRGLVLHRYVKTHRNVTSHILDLRKQKERISGSEEGESSEKDKTATTSPTSLPVNLENIQTELRALLHDLPRCFFSVGAGAKSTPLYARTGDSLHFGPSYSRKRQNGGIGDLALEQKVAFHRVKSWIIAHLVAFASSPEMVRQNLKATVSVSDNEEGRNDEEMSSWVHLVTDSLRTEVCGNFFAAATKASA
eukprot:g3469.t1